LFGKALEKITEQIIARMSATPLGWPVLLLFACIGAAYIGVSHYRSDPTVAETVRDHRFVSLALLASTGFLAYAIVRFASPRRIVRITLMLLLIGSSAAIWWLEVRREEKVFRIDVVLDDKLGLQTSDIATFFSDVQQPHIRVTLLSTRLTPPSSQTFLDWALTRDYAAPLLRQISTTNHTAVVTPQQLNGLGWGNLFYVTSQRFSVISTSGIIADSDPDGKILLRKYLATMIPLAAIHGQALHDGTKLLQDRASNTEHGCLNDFSVDKLLMLEKLRRGPEMCKEEASEIEAVFGRDIAEEYKSILARAARKSAP